MYRAIFLILMLQLLGLRISFAQSESVYMLSHLIRNQFVDDSVKRNYSLAAWNYSFIGDYGNALKCFDKTSSGGSSNASIVPDSVDMLTFRPAREFLIEKSKAYRIVIINEAHHQPMHRVFTESLLEDLYEAGFRYLGLETLAEDSLINIRKWPLVNDGFYTREPQFGNMIRAALQIGFRVFGYESVGKNGAEREKEQAANIAGVLKDNPDARVLIHCGFGHVVEGPTRTSGKMMAGELKSITGIDPLTIDQVEFTERGSAAFEPSLLKSKSVDVSSVILDRSGNMLSDVNPVSRVDVQVIHPRSSYLHDRPTWLLRNDTWRMYKVSDMSTSLEPPYLVSAYWLSEKNSKSVPVDQIEVNANSRYLVLPPGRFQLVLRDANGKVEEATIDIKN